jgi:hypothetical protein
LKTSHSPLSLSTPILPKASYVAINADSCQ